MFSGLQNQGEIADRGAVEAGENPIAQEHWGTSWIGEFKDRECKAGHLDANERETGPGRLGKQKPKKHAKKTNHTKA